MTVTLYHGDCLEVLKTLDAGSVDLTVTSPPYDNLRTYGKDFDADAFDWHPIIAELYRVTKPGGVVVWVVADATINGSETGTSFKQALWAMECGFNLHDTMIYEVAGTGAKGSHYAYWQAFEFMFILSKGRAVTVNRLRDRQNKQSGKNQSTSTKYRALGVRDKGDGYVTQDYGVRTNIWRYAVGANGDDATEHPAPFPEALARDHIASWSNPGDVVLDPMMGSGTTGKMAVLEGRRFIGIEIDPAYFAIAERRIAEAQMQLRMPLEAKR